MQEITRESVGRQDPKKRHAMPKIKIDIAGREAAYEKRSELP